MLGGLEETGHSLTGHDGALGEMSGEEIVVDGDVLQADSLAYSHSTVSVQS